MASLQSHFGVHEKFKSFENQANNMLFWITWIIGNLVHVKICHTQNSFQVFNQDYTSLSFFTPDWYPGVHYPKARFSLPQDNSIWFILFPWLGQLEPFWTKSFKIIQIWLKPFPLTETFLHWGNLNPFRPKSPKTVQTWLKLCPLTGTPHKPSLIQKNLSRQFTWLHMPS